MSGEWRCAVCRQSPGEHAHSQCVYQPEWVPAAPVVQGADELREAIARSLFESDRQAIAGAAPWDDEMYGDGLLGLRTAYRQNADALLSGPLAQLLAERRSLAATLEVLLAERDELRAKVERVRAVLVEIDRQAEVHDMHDLVTAHHPIARRLRRALDGEAL